MAEQQKGASRPGALGADTIITLTVLVLGAMIMILNETSLSVALTSIMADFSIPATTAQWLTTGFMLTMAVVIPTTGFLLERLTTRQIFLTGTTLFLVGSVVAALAPSFLILLLARIIQAAGTALMMPLLMTVTMTLVPPQRRGSVMGIISIVISVAPALGPTVGGFILQFSNWHVIFWAMVPLVALIMVFGILKLNNVGQSRPIALDLLSVVLSAVAFGGLIYGLSSMNIILSGDGLTEILLTLLGLISLVVFVLRQRALGKEDRALMDLRPFAVPNYTLTLVLMLLSFGLMLGSVTVLPIYLQTSLAVSAAVTGLVVMPGGLLQGFISPIVGRIFDAKGPRPLLIPGVILLTISLWLLSRLDNNSAVWMVIGMHILMALGMALMMTPLMTTALSSLPGHLYGHGSAIMNTLQQLAGATGTAFLVVFLSRGTESGMAAGKSLEEATAQGTQWAFMFAGGLALVAVVVAFLVKKVEISAHH